MSDRRTVYRVCPFCEATCGLAVDAEGDAIRMVRGDKDDPFSRGFICPKAYGLKELYHDPDRLRRPVRRTASLPVASQTSAQSRHIRMHWCMSIVSAAQASAQARHIREQYIK